MKMDELKLLQILKNGLLKVNPAIQDTNQYFGHKNPKWKNSLKAQKYYLLRKEDNLYKAPPEQMKLDSRINAVRSSTALIYNTLYLCNLKCKNGKQFQGFKNKFEIPFPAIKSDSNSSHTAKLDAGLISTDKKELLLFEAKCLEWFNKNPKGLKKVYLNQNRYLHQQSAKIFIPLFNLYIEKDNSILKYKAKTIRYDAIQMLIHSLGIYNFCLESSEKHKTIKLINLVWNYDCAEYSEEEKEGLEFMHFANQSLKDEFNKLDVDFSVEYVRYSDFLNCVDWSNDIEHRNYLKRYESN